MGFRGAARAVAVVAFACLTASAGHAQSPAEFYRGKTVELYIGYSVGGGYDVYARLLARHMGKHIPGNPQVVPKNMEGAGSLRLTNWLFNIAPKDGTVFGAIGRGTAFDPLLGRTGGQFTAAEFSWIGSANDEVSVCAAWHTTGITKFEDLKAKEMIVGGTGAANDTDQFPKLLNGVLGTRMKLITGYPGGNEVGMAMERGEVQGRCGWSWSSVKALHKDWIDSKKVHILAQLSLSKHPDLPHVPLITDLANTAEQGQILKLIFARQVMGRPFLAPPRVPADRVAALRKAFMDTMNDPELLAEADKAQLEITPVSGEDIQKLVKDVYETPPEIARSAGMHIQ